MKRIIVALAMVVLVGIVLGLPTSHAVTPLAQTQIPDIEYQALIALYNATDGANWTDNSGWLVTDTPCNWFRVTCAGDVISHVTTLLLFTNNLSGTLPVELGNLGYLQEFDLASNQLSGSIPSQLGNLSNLLVISLSGNQLSGAIPAELGSLSNLLQLYLHGNELSGSIPDALGNLSSLVHLFLYQNHLSGSVPASFGNLRSLGQLSIGNNSLLSGRLPSSLMSLNLNYFFFTGTDLCEPADAGFQAWLSGIAQLYRTNVLCPADCNLPLVQRGS